MVKLFLHIWYCSLKQGRRWHYRSVFTFYGTLYLVNREETFPCHHTSNTSKDSSHWKKKYPDNSVIYNSSFMENENTSLFHTYPSTALFFFSSPPFPYTCSTHSLSLLWKDCWQPFEAVLHLHFSFSCHLTPPWVPLWWVFLYCLFIVLWLALFTKPQY